MHLRSQCLGCFDVAVNVLCIEYSSRSESVSTFVKDVLLVRMFVEL